MAIEQYLATLKNKLLNVPSNLFDGLRKPLITNASVE